jgi:cyanophycin synthetase
MLELYTNSADINIFIATAKALGLETEIIRKRPNFCRISLGSTHLLINDNALSITSTVHRKMVYDKYLTLRLLEKAGVPCPKATLFRTHQEKEVLDFVAAHRPVVIKPKTGSMGNGVCVNPQNNEAVLSAIQKIKDMGRDFVQVESLIEGSDYRILLYGGELMGIVKWVPPYIIGDGNKTLKELVEIKSNYRVANRMTAIVVEPGVIERQRFDFEAVLPKGISCNLNSISRYAVGGETLRIDSSAVNPDNLKICLRAAEATFLNFSGVDLISKDIGVSCFKNGAAINEINACPQIFEHYFADGSEDTREAKNVLKKYFQL